MKKPFHERYWWLTAALTDCSTDYLLGLTDRRTPA